MEFTNNSEILDDTLNPETITLSQAINNPPQEFPKINFTGFAIQEDFRIFKLSIKPTSEEIQALLKDYALKKEDIEKYLEIIKRMYASHPEFMSLNIDIESILKFCLATTWLVTGPHDLDGSNFLMMDDNFGASSLVDIDKPPFTKCSFFNSAFVYLFLAACSYFKREDLKSKYQFIEVGRYSHAYLALVTKSNQTYFISAIDPYHTTRADELDKSNIDIEYLYSQLDKTEERADELPKAFKEIQEKNKQYSL